MLPYRLLLFLCLLVSCAPHAASAQVALKPRGDGAAELRLRAISSRTLIRQGFAVTTSQLTFHNELSDTVEADFIYTVPPESVVRYFAYWFGEEKVVARVVEKSRAAGIYSHITTRRRDPALIEMLDRHTFRARIFPVLAGRDLKVEMVTVQALPSDQDGTFFTVPLATSRETVLDEVDIRVTVAPGHWTQVANNHGLPIHSTSEGNSVHLTGTRYRTSKDLRLNLTAPPAPVQATHLAARSGGSIGFFALTLRPQHSLTDVRLRFEGGGVHDVTRSTWPSIRHGRTVAVYGRYRQPGLVRAVLTGRSSQGPVTVYVPLKLRREAEPNHPGVSLWASERLATLPASTPREQVVRMSLRFGLPSRFTSWLAVPAAEMARYREEKRYEHLYSLAGSIARAEALGQGSSTETQRRLRELRRLGGRDAADILDNQRALIVPFLSAEIARLLDRHGRETSATRLLRKRMHYYLRRQGYTALQSRNSSRDQLLEAVSQQLYAIAFQMADAVAVGGTSSPAYRRHLRRWERLQRFYPQSRADQRQMLGWAVQERLDQMARAWAVVKWGPRPDTQRLSTLRQRMDRVAAQWQLDSEHARQNAESSFYYQLREGSRDALVAERARPQPDEDRLRALEQEYRRAARALGNRTEDTEVRLERLRVRADLERLEAELASVPASDRPRLEQLTRRQATLQARAEELRARMGDPLIRVNAPRDARNVVAVLPEGDLLPLTWNEAEHCWQVRFDIPGHAQPGAYAVRVWVELADGTRRETEFRYTVDVTPPKATCLATLTPEGMLQLRADGDGDLARVVALTPWGARVILKPVTGGYLATLPVPVGALGAGGECTFVLTDKAHNRATVTTVITAGDVAP